MDDRIMVHDCAITEGHVLLFDFPVTFDLEGAMAGKDLPYAWNPSRPARVGVLPLDGPAEAVRWCEVPQGFVFHAFNAFEVGDGRIVLDLVVWPKVFDVDRLGPGEGTSRTERWTLDPAIGTTAVAVLTDLPIEFPRIDERLTGTAHRLGYAVQVGSPGSIHMPLHRIDVERGSVETLDLGPSWAFGEVVFVPRSAGASESEGWLVGYATDRETARSDLVVVAADHLAAGPVARVHLPVRVPDGFHGNWLPDRA